jgi:heme oxygenase
MATPPRRLGALYVVEGSALGGLVLARGLDSLLGRDATDGRLFFTGRGRGARAGWSTFLQHLSRLDGDPAAEIEAIGAAQETFAVFAAWLETWRAKS